MFPMYVGVIPLNALLAKLNKGVPHVCGGDPRIELPKNWREIVFPMYVGVILFARRC